MMKTIYFAAPLFSVAEIQFNKNLAMDLENNGYKIILPQEECDESLSGKDIYLTCKSGIERADVVLAVLDGADHDSGTSWECGYAVGIGKPVVVLRTDFRTSGDTGGFNAMLYFSAKAVINSSSDYLNLLLKALSDL